MLTSMESIASTRGAATLLAFLLSLFVHGQVSSSADPASNAPRYERVATGKAAFVQRAGSRTDPAAEPSRPPLALAGPLGVRTGAHLYPAPAWQSAQSRENGLPAAVEYYARAPPVA